jgi:beta-phosphoglucomutase
MSRPIPFPSTAKAAIFDMDGTMIQNMAFHKQAWQKYLEIHNIHLSEKEFRQKISGKKNDQIFTLVFGRTLTTEEIEKYSEEKEKIYRELYADHITEVAGLTDFLHSLQAKNIQLAIATTAPAGNRAFALKALGLENVFEVILGDEHVRNGKPHPEIFLSTAQALDVRPEGCVVFEDSPPGVAAGKAAGMQVIALLTSHTAQELSGADFFINDFTELRP